MTRIIPHTTRWLPLLFACLVAGCSEEAPEDNSARSGRLFEQTNALYGDFCQAVWDCYPDNAHEANGCTLQTEDGDVQLTVLSEAAVDRINEQALPCEAALTDAEWEDLFEAVDCEQQAARDAIDCLAICNDNNQTAVAACAEFHMFDACEFPEAVAEKFDACF